MYINRSKPKYWSKNIVDKFSLKYYLNIESRVCEGHFNIFDDNGIPLSDYGGNIGIQYNPVNVCAYALGNLNIYLKVKEKKYLNIFLRMADWLIENQVIVNDIGVWYYNFNWKYVKKPWISSMAQGEALSVLARAFNITNDSKYLYSAQKCLSSFKFDIKDGGITGYIDSKYKIFEEYVSEVETHVLNGFIYSLLGLFDYFKFTGDIDAKHLFEEGIYTLENCLNKYDTGYWSKYDLYSNNLASYMYHTLHIVQLNVLYDITGNKILENYADIWSKYQNSYINCIRALFLKVLQKLFKP